jgi:hypothetical protein
VSNQPPAGSPEGWEPQPQRGGSERPAEPQWPTQGPQWGTQPRSRPQVGDRWHRGSNRAKVGSNHRSRHRGRVGALIANHRGSHAVSTIGFPCCRSAWVRLSLARTLTRAHKGGETASRAVSLPLSIRVSIGVDDYPCRLDAAMMKGERRKLIHRDTVEGKHA